MIDGAGGGETLPRHPASKARHLLLGEKAWGAALVERRRNGIAIVRDVRQHGIRRTKFGIFKAVDEESAKTLGGLLQKYLEKRIDTWNPSYDADQFPKIKNATVKVMGQYAVFCILSDADREAVYSAVENMLLGK